MAHEEKVVTIKKIVSSSTASFLAAKGELAKSHCEKGKVELENTNICNHILKNLLSEQTLPPFASHLFLAGGSSQFLTTNAAQITEKVVLFACTSSSCRGAIQQSLLPGQSHKYQMYNSL